MLYNFIGGWYTYQEHSPSEGQKMVNAHKTGDNWGYYLNKVPTR